MLVNILKDKFHLRYGKTQASNLKYRDPTYNEKRRWVARLLAQFMYEEVVIISLDESNFRSETFPSRQWEFDANFIKKTEN